MTPSPSCMCEGKRTISKTTLSPGWAFFAGVTHRNRFGEHRAVDLHHAQAGRLEVRADEFVGFAFDDFDNHAARIAKTAAFLRRRTSTLSPLAASSVSSAAM